MAFKELLIAALFAFPAAFAQGEELECAFEVTKNVKSRIEADYASKGVKANLQLLGLGNLTSWTAAGFPNREVGESVNYQSPVFFFKVQLELKGSPGTDGWIAIEARTPAELCGQPLRVIMLGRLFRSHLGFDVSVRPGHAFSGIGAPVSKPVYQTAYLNAILERPMFGLMSANLELATGSPPQRAGDTIDQALANMDNMSAGAQTILDILKSSPSLTFADIEARLRRLNSKFFLVASPKSQMPQGLCIVPPGGAKSHSPDFYLNIHMSKEARDRQLKDLGRSAEENLELLAKTGYLMNNCQSI